MNTIPVPHNLAAIGVIGGADGLTAIFVTSSLPLPALAAVAALLGAALVLGIVALARWLRRRKK